MLFLTVFTRNTQSKHNNYSTNNQLEALRYKPECRGFDSRRCHWNLSLA